MKVLTKEEEQLLNELSNRLSDLNNIDGQHLERRNLLRFLRARNHSVTNAEKMFRTHIEWRVENDLDNILEWEHPEEYKLYWPWEFGGVDKMGGPVLVLPIGKWDPFKVTGRYNDFIKYSTKSMERLWQEIQYRGKGKPCHQQFSIIFDVKGVGFKNVYHIEAMKGTLELVRIFEANYPETMRLGLIFNGPYMFEVIWRLIKPFVSDYTYSKLRFLGSSDKNDLKTEILKYMDENQFPPMYGGTGYIPTSKEKRIDFDSTAENHNELSQFSSICREHRVTTMVKDRT